jgi:EAL and modified HD-GYP domain-containing signal transduction protein
MAWLSTPAAGSRHERIPCGLTLPDPHSLAIAVRASKSPDKPSGKQPAKAAPSAAAQSRPSAAPARAPDNPAGKVEPPSAFTFIARQPIYDSAMAVTAFEILYKQSQPGGGPVDPRHAALQALSSAALEIGLDKLAGGLPVHINFPAELLVDVPQLPFPPERVVVDVREEALAEPKAVVGLQGLRARGHTTSLDGYSRRAGDPALLTGFNSVKLQITDREPDELTRIVKELGSRGVKLIAAGVATVEQFERCIALGFEGFQGDFLQHPQTFRAKRVPSNRLSTLRLVASLQNENFAIAEVERLLSQDISMSYHVLRCINSSFYNLPRKVDSIRQAIVILGLENLRQLCTLLCLQGLEDRPPSLFVHALTRARLCEQLGKMGGAKDAGPFFMTGLFSLLNALVGIPTEKIVEELPLSPAISRALVSGDGDLGSALQCTRAYERAAWTHVIYGDVAPHLIRAAYVDAVFWAEQARTLIAA